MYANSQTRISKIVRNIIRGEESAIPAMTGRLPLEILVEIGVEKLRRDYVHAIMCE